MTLTLNNPELFIGAILRKKNIVATCTHLENYTRTDGKNTQLLVWNVIWNHTDESITVKCSNVFKTSYIPSRKVTFFKLLDKQKS